MLGETLIRQGLDNFQLQPFGLTFPRFSRRWVDVAQADISGQITYSRQNMQLQSSANWLAPFGGLVHKVGGGTPYNLPVSLMQPGGTAVTQEGLVLQLDPGAYLRLRRLYANLLEDNTTHNPRRERGESLRSVPNYFFIEGSFPGSQLGGQIDVGEDIGMSGNLTIYDEQGHPIDPLSVASALLALAGEHEVLLADDSAPDQLTAINDLETNGSFLVRLVRRNGTPYDGTNLMENLESTGAFTAQGIFPAAAFSGTDTTILREINRKAGTGNSGDFPDAQARLLMVGAAAYGRLSNRVRLPALPGGVTLKHDFFTLEVLDLTTYLTGTPDAAFNGSKIEPKPIIRLHDHIQLLSSGNDVMGGLSAIVEGSPDDALLVGETIEEDFTLPPDLATTQWPDFPALPGGLTATMEDSLPPNLRAELIEHSTAAFIDEGQPVDVNVLLTLTGLPVGAAVRAYHRRLGTDFTEERGDGAGGTVGTEVAALSGRTYNGLLVLRLEDPLGLEVTPGNFVAAVEPQLNVDLVVVLRNGTRRIYGNVQLPISTTAVADTTTPVDNGLRDVARRGIGHAGLVGLPGPTVNLPASPSAEDLLNAALQAMGETNPIGRDAPRLPLMLRREILAGSRRGTNWRGLISGSRVDRSLHTAEPRRGAPGSPGSRETQSTGLYTQHGRLAYTLARHALRRTESFYTRLPILVDDTNWGEPAEPTALAIGTDQTADAGPFASVVLQTISPNAETPELALLKSLVDGNINSIPTSFDALVDQLKAWVNSLNVGSLPGVLGTGVTRLRTEVVNWLEQQKDGNALSESQRERLYSEVLRELSTACYGRRDSLWALEEGIQSARNFIYLETPALGPVRYGTAGNEYSRDVLKMIQDRMNEVPALKLMICVPKVPEYDRRYHPLRKKEIAERFKLFVATTSGSSTTTPLLRDDRTVVFHPMGFPGRPSGLNTQTVIIDDQWMLTGSTTMRRRGLTFDGGTDVALTGFDRVGGKVTAIRDHRVALLQQRLQLERSNKTTLAGSNQARLRDGRAAFTLIREMLRADGYGLIERLWDGKDPHIAYTEPTMDENIWNPEGQTYSAGIATLVSWLLSQGSGSTTVFHDV
ncbi:hypothetical protein [Lewinella sp. W8]|uniref:hypothetical protein n=1 Tax=Lewinella sp. W8 TaxID=2528208 RepID=UPI0010677F18|nr:hypothetical protein [Lewinella sp. W8]MTB50412.1 hypothetical protein [Lewinella sp. W8]